MFMVIFIVFLLDLPFYMSGDIDSEKFRTKFTSYFMFFILLTLLGGSIIVLLSYYYEIKYEPGRCDLVDLSPDEKKIA